MNTSKVTAFVVLAGFLGLNLYAIEANGLSALVGLFTLGNAWAVVLGVDLMIALSMVSVWVWRDAKSRGMAPLPYVVLTLATGSIGSLLYILRRPSQPESRGAGETAVLGVASV